MRKLLIAMTVLLGLYSCSSPLDKEYNDETVEQDTEAIRESEKLTDEELGLIAGWIVKSKLQDKDLTNKKYSEILKEAKDFKNEQQELAEKAKKEEKEKQERLGGALTVAMYDKGYREYDYQEYLTYSFAFENKTQKDIRAFKGIVSIQDLFNSEIKEINLTVDDPISAGEIFRATYTTEYNQFMDEDSRLKGKDMEDLNVVWKPEKIIFKDGSTLE